VHPVYTPDRAIVAALRAIDPGLSVAWIHDQERWAVFHDLQTAGNPDVSARALARELARDYRAGGYEVPFHECLQIAFRQVEQDSLVCVVTEPDGSYRPLDHRIVDKLRRMDWFRRNFYVRDWILHAQAASRKLEQSKRRDRENIWQAIEQDKVFRRMASDLLQGYHPVDSVSSRPEEVAA
jgi:hypothetical protein